MGSIFDKHIIYRSLLIISLASLFCSCSVTTHYYSTMDTSSTNIHKTDEGDFLEETDSVYVIYSFYGEDAEINIDIYNKTNKTIYIDWTKSGVKLGNTTYYYKDDRLIENHLNAILPQSQVNNVSYCLERFPFDLLEPKFKRQDFPLKHDIVSAKTANFSGEDSPLKLKSFITLYSSYPKMENEICLKHDFYLSTLVKSKNITPNEVLSHINKRGDAFFVKYVRQSDISFDAAMALVGVGLFVLDAALSN